MPKYKLTKDEEDFFNTLKESYKNPYAETETYNPEAMRELNSMKTVLENIGDKRGRKYAMYNMLSKSKNFNDKNLFSNIDKSYWDESNSDDYVPPDIEKQLAKKGEEDAKLFWNWDSDKHWTKLPLQQLKDKAEKEHVGLNSYLEDVQQVQQQKDREQQLKDEFGGWLGAAAMKLLYPRATEKVLQGKDLEHKDWMLDVGEQGLYTLAPADRFLAGAKGAEIMSKAPKLSKIGAAVFNPTVAETTDAIAYNGEDTDRAKISPIDIGVGTGINMFMDKLFGKAFKDNTRPGKPTEFVNSKKWGDFNDKINTLKLAQEQAEKEGNKTIAEIYNNKILDEISNMVKANKKYSPKLENAKQNLKLDVESLISNKGGDLLSEDPKRTKRALRSAIGPGGFVAMPLINDLVESYYNQNKTKTFKQNADDLIKGLGGF